MGADIYGSLLDEAIRINESKSYDSISDKFNDLQKIMVSLVEKKEEDMALDAVQTGNPKNKYFEIETRKKLAKEKSDYYNQFLKKIKEIRKAYKL